MRSRPSPLSLSLLVAGLLAGASVRAAAQTPEVLVARGVQAFNSGDLKTAVPLLRRALKGDPGHGAAGHYLGLALIKQGRLKQGRRALAAAAQLDPENPRLLLDLGLAYRTEGNAAWAVRYLRAASELAPRDERIRYHLGLALLQMEAVAEAVPELQRARFASGVDQPALKLRLGLARYKAREWERSRQTLASILTDDTQGRMARALLRASYEAEGVRASFLSIQLALGAAVDTNPLYEVEQDGQPLTGRTAVGPSLAGAVTLRPWADERNLLWGSLRGSRTFYFPTAEAPADSTLHVPEDASPSHVGATANYARRLYMGSGRGTLQLSAGYSFDLTFLDGNARGKDKPPPLSDPSMIYLEEHGGHVMAQRDRPDGSRTLLRYSLTHQAYADLARSNTGTELAAEHTITPISDLRLLGWLSFKYEAAEKADYDAVVPGVGVGASYLAPLDLVVGLRFGYALSENFASTGGRWAVAGHDGHRLDHELRITAEVGRALFAGLRLRAVYNRLQQLSTVDDFDIARDYITLTLSWSYP